MIALTTLLFAVVESVGQAVIRRRVASEEDWERAGRFVRSRWSALDGALASPPWAGPLMRRALGDTLSPAGAAPADWDAYDRIWEFSLRGATHGKFPKGDRPLLSKRFGRVLVRAWPVTSNPVRDLVATGSRSLSVTRGEGSNTRPCPRRRAPALPGGIWAGVMPPREYHFCGDSKHPWLWVGRTIMADGELQPRTCIWQHAAGPEPITATLPEVPVKANGGYRVVLHAGRYYRHDHETTGTARIMLLADGEPRGRMILTPQAGWKRMEVPILAPGEPQDERWRQVRFSVEVTATVPHQQSVCWSAQVYGPDE